MRKFLRTYGGLLIPVILLIGLDQLTKYLVESRLAYGEIWAPWSWLTPYARIIHWTNTGVAFGLFQGMGWIFSVFAIAISIAILYYFPKVEKADWAIRVALVLEMAGAIGNMIDRLRINGAVLDFISVGNFPVFNVADSCITVGVVFLAIGILIQDQREKKKQSTPSESGEASTSESSGKLD
ncbi:MAG: signal peptidase II [Anaerolineaceae bacterium]